jgi:hypothetical protein
VPLAHALEIGAQASLQFARTDQIALHVVIVTTLGLPVNRGFR